MKMSKALLLSAVLSVAAMAANAQVHFGIKGGFTESYITNADDGHFTGFGGIFVNANLGYGWHIQPEIDYSGAGAVYSANGFYYNPNNPYNTTVSLGYVQIPVMIQYRFGPVFYLEAGPQLGILTNASYVSDGERSSASSDYKSTDFAVDFGAGFRLGPVVSIYTRYCLGLSDIYSDASYSADYNRLWQFGIAFTFPNHTGGGRGGRGGYYR
jgi:hypothetical protein